MTYVQRILVYLYNVDCIIICLLFLFICVLVAKIIKPIMQESRNYYEFRVYFICAICGCSYNDRFSNDKDALTSFRMVF